MPLTVKNQWKPETMQRPTDRSWDQYPRMIESFPSAETRSDPHSLGSSFALDADLYREYAPGRRPYVEFNRGGAFKIHALVLGWQQGMIRVQFPLSKTVPDARVCEWIHRDDAVRIRRQDSVWVSSDDDPAWHGRQDERINYRPDPWVILVQDEPRAEL